MATLLVPIAGLLLISGCASESTEEIAFRACIAADVTSELMGETTYEGIRPENPEFPSIDEVSVIVYDTGYYDLSGTANGVRWTCLWSEKDPIAKFVWGS